MTNFSDPLQNAPKDERILIKIFAAISFVLLIISGFFFFHSYQLVEHGTQRPGEVIALTKNSKGSKAPVVRYVDHLGKQQTYRSRTFSHPSAYDVGEQVQVIYVISDPEYADKVKIASFFELWGVSAILGLIGFGFGCFPVFRLVYYWRRPRKTSR